MVRLNWSLCVLLILAFFRDRVLGFLVVPQVLLHLVQDNDYWQGSEDSKGNWCLLKHLLYRYSISTLILEFRYFRGDDGELFIVKCLCDQFPMCPFASHLALHAINDTTFIFSFAIVFVSEVWKIPWCLKATYICMHIYINFYVPESSGLFKNYQFH